MAPLRNPQRLPARRLQLLPARCPVCQALGDAPCERCRRSFAAPPPLPPPPGLSHCASVLRYDAHGRAVVTAVKYRNHRDALAWLGGELARRADAAAVDVLTWAPTAPARRRARGYDQAELLARAIGRAGGLTVAPTLRRRPGPPQTGRSLQDRHDGPRFVARRGLDGIVARRIVGLVDDVVTSGATMSHAAQHLHDAGAAAVVGLSAARTPSPE